MPSSSISTAAATGLSSPASTPVAAAMSPEILAIAPGSSLPEAARLMAGARVHGVVVSSRPWGFVSDLDVVSAAVGAETRLPRPAVTVSTDASLVEAGRLMGRHGVSHLLVTDASGQRALGVVSALDVARHIAFGPAER